MASQNDSGLASAATDNEARKIVGSDKRDKRSSKPSPNETQAAIRSELRRSDCGRGLGLTARGVATVRTLHPWPIARGFDSSTPLEARRVDNLCIRVRGVEETTRLREGHNG
jgi:hypothetical protein